MNADALSWGCMASSSATHNQESTKKIAQVIPIMSQISPNATELVKLHESLLIHAATEQFYKISF